MADSRIPLEDNQCLSLKNDKAVATTLIIQLLNELETRMDSTQKPTLARLKTTLTKQIFCTEVCIKNAQDLRDLFKIFRDFHGCVLTALVCFCGHFIETDPRYTTVIQSYYILIKKFMPGQEVSIIWKRRFPAVIQKSESMQDGSQTCIDTFSKYQARNDSFLYMIFTHDKNIDTLSASGFYATGDKDEVRCYNCNIFRRIWKPADDPLTNHVHSHPDCPYRKTEKNQEKVSSLNQTTAKRRMDIGQAEAKTGQKRIKQPPVTKYFPRVKKTRRKVNKQKKANTFLSRRKLSENIRKRRQNMRTFYKFNFYKANLDMKESLPRVIRHNHEQSAATAIRSDHSSGVIGDERSLSALKHSQASFEEEENFNETMLVSPTKEKETCIVRNSDRDLEIRTRLDQKGELNSIEDAEKARLMDTNDVGTNDVVNGRTDETFSGDRDKKITTDPTFNILQQENGRLNEQFKCKICQKEKIWFVFIPCGHLVACIQCGERAVKCIDCKLIIREKRKIYLV
ncbi:baculoviral IAP repeat-containing protein 3-like [Mizuhopecten yessoensis]|uniref:Baculoviral IAP repeat-containing protein 2 n=1 Tax=Mizuhopecten yessoensis TaxID=6573 RepID=A0A210Q7L1_MIZYE|nr:baculoviral IAP repeat-containing protein 3-like [Mizuhopecten yessoensis]XP_021365179.1 baculoviral IAP repeat-containing protein 3-like [Mizuhopecten yessoensis]OWF44727.1 Baculoviral IAP repeat-containing protein 2 [Mizuhopecten yessoensis]